MADIHFGNSGKLPLPAFSELVIEADVLVLAGDLTDHGLPEEAQGLVQQLASVRIPIVAVLGNHDFESGREEEVQKILTDSGVTVLDGTACEIQGVGFAGTKGFAGGFGRRTLEPWGEPTVKLFVQEAVNESLKLESALAVLRTEKTIAVLHYAPILATVEGEPVDLFPFLGCSRLEDPLNRYGATAVVHGHAHRGALEGRTTSGIPVFNVALPLLRCERADHPNLRMLQVGADGLTVL